MTWEKIQKEVRRKRLRPSTKFWPNALADLRKKLWGSRKSGPASGEKT